MTVNRLRVAAFAGIAALLTMAAQHIVSAVLGQRYPYSVYDLVLLFVYSFAFIAYWYGLALIAIRYTQRVLKWAAAISIVTASLGTLLAVAYVPLDPANAIAMGAYIIGGMATTIALFLAALGMWRLKGIFGKVAQLYAALSGIAAILSFFAYMPVLDDSLHILLFITGTIILFRASSLTVDVA